MATGDFGQNEEWQLKRGIQKHLFEAAPGVSKPWLVRDIDFDMAMKVLTIHVGFAAGTRFSVSAVERVHPVNNTQTKRSDT